MEGEVEYEVGDDKPAKTAAVIRELLLYMLTVIFTLPLASIINRFLPAFVVGNIDFDLLLSVTITFFFMKWLVFKYRKLFIIISMGVFI
jgi:hypothetical protein